VKVAEIPPITADWVPPANDNPTWKDAPLSQIGGMQWKAVYTGEDIAFLLKWIDRDMMMDSPGAYIWDPETGQWSQYDGNAREWMNLAWDINSVQLEKGCNAFCHEDPPGSGIFHHQTATLGEYADSWMLFQKHGFNQKPGEGGVQTAAEFGLENPEDRSWFAGEISAQQNAPLIFENTNAKNPRNVVSGEATFIGYAEDNIIAAPGDPIDADRTRPRDIYCQNCHDQIELPYDPLQTDITYPDDGQPKYFGNYDVPYTSPKYMEKAPIDFVDAMVLTQDEIDSGEAVSVASLSPQQINEYWAKYVEVNATVPQLVLREPGDSQSDVLVASNWKNGVWTMEIHRTLVTPYGADDIQFEDLDKDYHFSLTISNSDLLLGPALGEYGGILTFEH
jgi:hypothetical protein